MADWREAIEQDLLDKLGLRLDDLVNGTVQVDLSRIASGISGSLSEQLDRIEKDVLLNQVILRLILFYLPRVPVSFKISTSSGPNMPVGFKVVVETLSGPPVGFQIQESQ